MNDEMETIVLMDEDGTEHEFEIVDVIELDGDRFAILAPVDSEEDAIVLKITKDEDGEDVLEDLTDEEFAKVEDYWNDMMEGFEDED
jgi:uncharacterized protein YrzB (UPF0473 family)